MSDHAILGTPRQYADGMCSKCGLQIPDEHVPLILWADGGKLMWVYCELCEQGMFEMLEFNKREKAQC
jgi:hypothetical protein